MNHVYKEKKMVKKVILLGIPVMMLVLGIMFIACSGDDNPAPANTITALTGTVTITGTAQVGETLTTNTAALGGSGTISYQWKRGTVNVGTNNNTYVVQTADAGSTITVTVTRSGNSGSVTSAGVQIPAIPVSINVTVRNTAEWNAALDTIKNGGNGTTAYPKTYTITVSGNISVTGSTGNSFGSVSYIAVTINGNGKLYIVGRGALLTIRSNQTVYIDSTGLTLQGLKTGQNDSTQDNSSAIISISGGTLELRNGTISGNKGGNGVSVDSSGSKFIMTGGTISDNSDSGYGGGVYIGGGSFTMSGGTISNNSSGDTPKYLNLVYGFGGGVCIDGGSFIMNGGAISGNSAIGGNWTSLSIFAIGGGGVYISSNNSSSFTKSGGGSISGNNITGSGVISNGKEVFFDGSPARYRNTPLGTTDDISTNTQTGWGQ
jgi:hypothetical protein